MVSQVNKPGQVDPTVKQQIDKARVAVPEQAAKDVATTKKATGITSVEAKHTDAPEGARVRNDLALQMGLDVKISAEGQKYIESLPTELRAELKSTSAAFTGVLGGSGGNTDALQSRWSDFVSRAATQGPGLDVNAMVQWVLRESYMETTEDLYFYAEKVKFFNACKKEIRNQLTEARNELAKYAGKDEETKLSPAYAKKDVVADFTGAAEPGTTSSGSATTKAELDAYIKEMEEKLSSVGDDAQLANVDLQNMLQKQQQTIQMMSNISKMLHDTALAIIRKIG